MTPLMNVPQKLDMVLTGLGREGVEMPYQYWIVLHQFPQTRLHTAEEEAQKRFLEAHRIEELPDGRFATELSRLLRGCVRTCLATKDIAIEFVRAGELHISLCLSKDGRRFRIHERWLDVWNVEEELGITPGPRRAARERCHIPRCAEALCRGIFSASGPSHSQPIDLKATRAGRLIGSRRKSRSHLARSCSRSIA